MNRSLDISHLITVLEDNFFKEGWLELPPIEAYFEEAKGFIVLDIISAANEILRYYHLLFLSGEYVLLSNYDDIFVKLENYLKEKQDEIDNLENEHLKLELQSEFRENILSTIQLHIKPTVIYFLRDLKIQINFEYKQGIFRGDKVTGKNTYIDESIEAYIRSFKLLVRIVRYEHFRNLLDNELLLRDLLVIRKDLEYFSINSNLKKAMHAKVSFLLKKMLYRRKISNSKTLMPEYIYSFKQQEDTILNLQNINIDSSLNDWDNLIKVHYGVVEGFKVKQRKRRREIEVKEHSSYLYQDYHGLIKVFKDDTKTLSQAENLLSTFDEREKNDLDFNNYSRVCTSSYLFNNCISLKCENRNMGVEEFKQLFFEIKNRQNRDDVRNYFPWLKLGQRMSRQIDEISADLSEPKKFKLFKELVSLFSKVIDKIGETYNWSRYKSFIPMQLPFKECQSNYILEDKKFNSVKLFFFSAFVLPLDYNNVKDEKDLMISKKNSYNELIIVYDKLQYVIEEVGEVSEKMRKQERRSVEILAIFSAVALFSIGSIQIFSNAQVINDPNIYYKFILSFGYSLSLFVLLIWIITRDNIKKVQFYHWVIVILFFIVTCYVIGYFLDKPIISAINPFFLLI